MALDIEAGVIKEIERQISERETDDPLRLILILEQSNHEKLNKLESNPAVKVGDSIREMGKGLMILMVIITWFFVVVFPNWLLQILTLLAGIDLSKIGGF